MTAAPLSRPVPVSDIGDGGLRLVIVADETERAAIAALNDALAVEALEARLEVRPFGRDGVAVSGQLDAAVRRTCGVTLEPFVEKVSEEIDVRFSPAQNIPEEEGGELEIGADDPPDPFVGGVIDLGAVVSEFLTLGLDPYPRKPGAKFQPPTDGDGELSPFAELRKLKRPDDGA